MMSALRRWSPEAWVLGGFFLFTVMALAGYATFALHPDMLARFPGAREMYASAYRLFSQGQIWISAAVLFFVVARKVGARFLPGLAAVYAISLLSELSGTHYGLPFGGYSYTHLLGYKILDHVPLVIPLSWFLMALPSWALAVRVFPEADHTSQRIFLASLLLTAWDLALDPAMSFLTPFWVWQDTGPYYGMPWLNLFGWYVTGIALMVALAALKTDRWVVDVDPRHMAAFYALNLLMPLGMCVAAGLGWAVLATLVTLAVTAALVARRVAAARPNPAPALGV